MLDWRPWSVLVYQGDPRERKSLSYAAFELLIHIYIIISTQPIVIIFFTIIFIFIII